MAVYWKRTTVLSLRLLRFCFVCFSDKTYQFYLFLDSSPTHSSIRGWRLGIHSL